MNSEEKFYKWFFELSGKSENIIKEFVDNLPDKLINNFVSGLEKHQDNLEDNSDPFDTTKLLLIDFSASSMKRYHPNSDFYISRQMDNLQTYQGTDEEEMLAKLTIQIKDSLIRVVKSNFDELQLRMSIAEKLIRMEEIFAIVLFKEKYPKRNFTNIWLKNSTFLMGKWWLFVACI